MSKMRQSLTPASRREACYVGTSLILTLLGIVVCTDGIPPFAHAHVELLFPAGDGPVTIAWVFFLSATVFLFGGFGTRSTLARGR